MAAERSKRKVRRGRREREDEEKKMREEEREEKERRTRREWKVPYKHSDSQTQEAVSRLGKRWMVSSGNEQEP